MMKNIHITLTEFRNESRVLKEIDTLDSSKVFDQFIVIALAQDDAEIKEESSENKKVIRMHLHSRKLPKNTIFQLVKFFEFMFKSFILVRRERADVVNLHTLALLPLGWLLKIILKVKLVYDAHELETEKNGLHGIKKRFSKFVEKIFIKSCDLIIVVGDNIADWYVSAYGIERPLVVKNAPRYHHRVKRNSFRESLGISSQQKVFLYQGGLVRGRGIQQTLDAFKARTCDSVVVVFMGYGELVREVQEAAKVHSNIYYHPAVSPGILLEYTSSADIGISFIENSCLSYYYCMPNKLFEYAMAGLPVIVSNMKEMSEVVETFHFGKVLPDFSTDSINAIIDCMNNQDVEHMSDNAYAFATAHSWEYQELIMLDGYKRMLNV